MINGWNSIEVLQLAVLAAVALIAKGARNVDKVRGG
jgi:hypothetical protein